MSTRTRAAGAFTIKPTKTRIAGAFTAKPLKRKVGGVFLPDIGGGGTPGPSPIVSAAFTAAENGPVTAYAPEIGPGFANYFQGWEIASGRARPTATAAMTYNTVTPPTAEYDVEADFVFLTKLADEEFSIAGRMSTAADTSYQALYFSQYNVLSLFKRVGGAATSLGDVGFPWPGDGAVRRIKLQIRNATKRVFVDGTQILSSADNAIAAAGKPGLIRFGASAPGDGIGVHLDNYAVTPAA